MYSIANIDTRSVKIFRTEIYLGKLILHKLILTFIDLKAYFRGPLLHNLMKNFSRTVPDVLID